MKFTDIGDLLSKFNRVVRIGIEPLDGDDSAALASLRASAAVE